MRYFAALLVVIMSFGPAAPAAAQFSSGFGSTTPFSTTLASNPSQSTTASGSSFGTIIGIGAVAAFGAALVAQLVPSVVTPKLPSFGGRITSVIPCPFSASLFVTIASARTGFYGVPEIYVWTPATITKLAGPPTHIGQQILGNSDVIVPCIVSVTPPVTLFGLRMFQVGTSAL